MNNKRFTISAFFLLLMLSIIAYPAGASSIAKGDSEQNGIKETINAYFRLRHESERSLQSINTTKIFNFQDFQTQEWLKLEQDYQDIKRAIADTFDNQVISYIFDLDYQKILINDQGTATVTVFENYKPHYKQNPSIQSELSSVHELLLKKADGKWLITFDKYEDEITQAFQTATKEELLSNIKQNYNNQFGLGKLEKRLTNPSIQSVYSIYSYNRNSAKTFADNNALSTNAPIHQTVKNAYQATYGQPFPSTWQSNYRREGITDCTNFVSQAIFQGANYTSGDANYFYPTPNDNNWYYKFSPNNSPSDMYGKGSSTWINVGSLYNFLTGNAGRGPYGHYTGTLCNLSSGDVVLMKSGGAWAHAVMISYINSCSYSATMYVDAHTSDAKQVPLANYSLYSWYPVVIDGYRD